MPTLKNLEIPVGNKNLGRGINLELAIGGALSATNQPTK